MRKNDLVNVNGFEAVIYDIDGAYARVRDIDFKKAHANKYTHLGTTRVNVEDMTFVKRTTKDERQWEYNFPANWEL